MTTLLGFPNVSTLNSEEVPTTSTRFSSGLPSVSIFRSTGMRKVSMSCATLPITRKPFCVRKMVYSSLNSGAPEDSIHWMKKYPRSCLETSCATFLKSSVDADFQLYRVANSFNVWMKAWSPMT